MKRKSGSGFCATVTKGYESARADVQRHMRATGLLTDVIGVLLTSASLHETKSDDCRKLGAQYCSRGKLSNFVLLDGSVCASIRAGSNTLATTELHDIVGTGGKITGEHTLSTAAAAHARTRLAGAAGAPSVTTSHVAHNMHAAPVVAAADRTASTAEGAAGTGRMPYRRLGHNARTRERRSGGTVSEMTVTTAAAAAAVATRVAAATPSGSAASAASRTKRTMSVQTPDGTEGRARPRKDLVRKRGDGGRQKRRRKGQ